MQVRELERLTVAVHHRRPVATLRSAASSASLIAWLNTISVPLTTTDSCSGITRVAIRCYGFSLGEPECFNTRIGAPARIRSRSSIDSPGTRPLTS